MRAVAVMLIVSPILAGCATEAPALEIFQVLLLPSLSDRVIVELDHVEAREPSAAAVRDALEVVSHAVGKGFSSSVSKPFAVGRPTSSEHRWEGSDLGQAERDTRDHSTYPLPMPRVAVLHILYVDGLGTVDRDLAGVQFGDHRIFIFPDTFRGLRMDRQIIGGNSTDDEYERTVLVHEIGHALGLVNGGVPMVRPHESSEVPHHSSNRQSAMWSGFDAPGGIRDFITGEGAPPFHFDADDLADLAAYRAEGERLYREGRLPR